MILFPGRPRNYLNPRCWPAVTAGVLIIMGVMAEQDSGEPGVTMGERAGGIAGAVAAIVMRERGISYLRMAKYFNRDHSTLVHAVNTFGTRYANDPKAHEMLDYARFEFLKDEEPAAPRKQYRRYGFATMEVGEVRSFEIKTAMEDRSVRRAAHKLNEFGDAHYITWLDREAKAEGARILNVKRLR